MKTHDLTRPHWGHNYSVINWEEGDLHVWLTPGPKVDDLIILPGKRGPIHTRVTEAARMVNVDDMYRIRVEPDEETP